jgi:hypothetical protein
LKHVLPSKNCNTSCSIDPQECNDYFSTIGEKLTESNLTDDTITDDIANVNSNFDFFEININVVLRELLSLPDVSKLDVLDMDCKLLRNSALLLAPLLTHIFNLSLALGHLPNDWKIARVTPIYKGKGSKEDINNYRPISVIPTIVKILEKCVKVQIVDYFISNNLFSSAQSAYLQNHSTQTALHQFVDHCLKNMDDGLVNVACFLDLSKAFDTLNRKKLLTKLEKYGLSKNCIKWFDSYLSNRSQIVVSNSSTSQPNNISVGVPQGTILGPILFIIYLNDLPNAVKDALIVIYADDTTLVTAAFTLQEAIFKMQTCLDIVTSYFKNNSLVINESKCKYMVITYRQKHLDLM